MRLIVERDVPVEMRDGTVLRSDIYRPDRAERFPVLLQRTPYNKALGNSRVSIMDAIRAASHGYAVVIQDTRGRFASEGETISVERLVDGCLEMLGGYDLMAETRSLLLSHAEGVAQLNTDTAEFAEAVGQTLQMIASTQEYQFT